MSWPHTMDGYHLTKDETGQLLKKTTESLAHGTGALLQGVDGLRGLPTLDLCGWEEHLRAGVRQRHHLD